MHIHIRFGWKLTSNGHRQGHFLVKFRFVDYFAKFLKTDFPIVILVQRAHSFIHDLLELGVLQVGSHHLLQDLTWQAINTDLFSIIICNRPGKALHWRCIRRCRCRRSWMRISAWILCPRCHWTWTSRTRTPRSPVPRYHHRPIPLQSIKNVQNATDTNKTLVYRLFSWPGDSAWSGEYPTTPGSSVSPICQCPAS